MRINLNRKNHSSTISLMFNFSSQNNTTNQVKINFSETIKLTTQEELD